MDFDVRKRKSWSEAGVSEIVGNIMILMITVVLFSSIMAFVQQMPVPEQATKVDFSARASFWSGGTKANLTVTHAGGATLNAADTIVLIEVDNVNHRYNMSDPVVGLKGTTKWSMGVTWAVTLTNTTSTSKITVTVVDMTKKSAVWTSQVTGGTGGNPPNILQRWVDSNNATPTPDPVLEWDDWSLYVTISDPDGDLNTTNGIWIDSSQIETDRAGANHRTDYAVSGDLYRWDFTNIHNRSLSAEDIDGRVILIHAWDKAGHQAVSSFVMTITILPTNIEYQSPVPQEGPPSSDSNLPSYIRWFYDNQGFGIFGEVVVNGSAQGIADTSSVKILFDKQAPTDQLLFIRFASKVMTNIFTENKLTVIDIRTGLSIVPIFNGSSTASAPFYPYPGGGGIYLYECQFKTSSLPVGAYTLSISLKNMPSTGETQKVYSGDKTIFITDNRSSIGFYPQIYLYRDSAYSVPWGDRYTPFQLTNASCFKIYVAIKVQDTDVPPNPNVAEVRISDGTKTAELYGVPPAGSMMSSINSFSRSGVNYYSFSIDLRLNNGAEWRGGTNAYSLSIAKLSDSNEGMYSLSEQVFITGAGLRADFFAGTTGMAGGNSNFNTREYLYYIQNNNFFSSRVLWLSESTPASNTDYTVTAMGVGDTDGDGDKDVLMGQASSNTLWFFENTLNTFGTWQSGSTINRKDGTTTSVTWIAFGDVNGDGHDDFAYSNSASTGQVVIYNTTYGSTGWIFTPPSGKGWTGTISKIALEDMTGDGRADLVVLASGKIMIYDLKYFYDPALISQKDIEGKGRFAYSTGTTVDFDIADVDYDGHLDIVTADTVKAFNQATAANGVNVNYYTLTAGTMKILDQTYNGNGRKVGPGAWVTGDIASTTTVNGAGIKFTENATGSQAGSLVATMKFQQLTGNPDQQLRVVARVGATNGSPDEVFYGWYSIDGVTYIPVMTISSTNFTYYNYTLPSTVMNKAIYLKFTDSVTTNTSGTPTDWIEIDMAGVFTDTFGGYTGYWVYNTDTLFTAVRAASIDGNSGNSYMEVVAAKHHDTVAANSIWKVFRATTKSTWTALTTNLPPGDTSFYVSSSSKVTAGYYNSLAPTLFDAVDINGDGFTDILVTNYTATSTDNSFIGFYMNLWSGTSMYWRYFPVHSWTINPPTGLAKDPWVCTTQASVLTVVG